MFFTIAHGVITSFFQKKAACFKRGLMVCVIYLIHAIHRVILVDIFLSRVIHKIINKILLIQELLLE